MSEGSSVNDSSSKRSKIEDIRRSILKDRNSRLWKDFTNSLRLISQVVFTRSSGFILEFLQNAEDAKEENDQVGVFRISFGRSRITISHNGKPFDETDIEALCGIRSSKKPEAGNLGYLGIGFKSVFKATDSPEIHSNGFHFKFDKNYPDWKNDDTFPWGITPVWIEQAQEKFDKKLTTFVIPLKHSQDLNQLKMEVSKLSPEIFLYLNWIKKIVITDEEDGSERVLENINEGNGVITFKDSNETRSYVIFRKEIKVPNNVSEDSLTMDYRRNVKARNIAVAFYIDESKNLDESPAGSIMSGLYSFVPLGEVSSGAKFLIQADFLVQPGRDAINYESIWNKWLVDEIANLSIEAFIRFKTHETWKYQFYKVFQFVHNEGTEAYERLFKPHLIDKVTEFVQSDKCVITKEQEWELPSRIYVTDEDEASLKGLHELGLCKRGEEAEFFNGKTGSRLLSRESEKFMPKDLFPKLNRISFLSDVNRLQNYSSREDKHIFFGNLYSWLNKHPYYEYYFYYTWRKRPKLYHQYKIILSRTGNIQSGGETYYIDQELYQGLDTDAIRTIESRYSLIDWDVFGNVTQETVTNLINFLRGFTGLQIIDIKKAYKDLTLPKIFSIHENSLSKKELVGLTVSISSVLGEDIESGTTIWVLCKDGRYRHSDEVIFSQEYNLSPGWEKNAVFLPELNYLDPNYLESCKDDVIREKLVRFMKACNVREDPIGGVEEFAMNVVKNWLENNKESLNILNVQDVHGRNLGYDIDVTKRHGNPIKIEVKGLSSEMDIMLTSHESEAADEYLECYYLAVVNSIPESHNIHFLKNPSYRGKKESILVPSSIWKMQSGDIH